MSNGGSRTAGVITVDTIKAILPILLLVASIVGAFYLESARVDRLTVRLDALCVRVDKLEAQMEALSPTLTDIQVRLAEIQRDLVYIKGELDRQGKTGIIEPMLAPTVYALATEGLAFMTPFR